MTTLRTIITDAYEESRLIPLNGTPEAGEYEKALRRLKVVIRSLFGHELGEPLTDVMFGTNGIASSHTEQQDQTENIVSTFLPINSRLLCNLTSSQTVYLPPSPKAGCRMAFLDVSGNFATTNLVVNANGRKVLGGTSMTLSTNGSTTELFYRDDLADWVEVEDLNENSDSPFPTEFDDMLVTMLSMRLNPSFGKEMTSESFAALSRAKSQFRSRYSQRKWMPSELALQIHPWNNVWDFNKGII